MIPQVFSHCIWLFSHLRIALANLEHIFRRHSSSISHPCKIFYRSQCPISIIVNKESLPKSQPKHLCYSKQHVLENKQTKHLHKQINPVFYVLCSRRRKFCERVGIAVLIKGEFTQKRIFTHHLLTLKCFQSKPL